MIPTVLKVVHLIEEFAINQMFVPVRLDILVTPVPIVLPYRDVCMEVVMRALNVIAFPDGKESTAIYVSNNLNSAQLFKTKVRLMRFCQGNFNM